MTSQPPNAACSVAKPVLFYDGGCGICQKSKDWIARRDKHQRLEYQTLQGELAQKIGLNGIDPDSLVYWRRNQLDQPKLERSDGVLAMLCDLGGLWKLLAILGKLVPRPLRDALYNWVAKNRHRFGSGQCSLKHRS